MLSIITANARTYAAFESPSNARGLHAQNRPAKVSMTRSIFCASPGKRNRARRNARSATSSGAPAKSNPDANADAVSRAAPSSAPRNSPTEDSSRRPARSSERRNAARTSASSLGAAPVSATRARRASKPKASSRTSKRRRRSKPCASSPRRTERTPRATNRPKFGPSPLPPNPPPKPNQRQTRRRLRRRVSPSDRRSVPSSPAPPSSVPRRAPPPPRVPGPEALHDAHDALRRAVARALRLRDAAVRGGPRERGHHSLVRVRGLGPLVAVVVHEQVNQNLRVGGEPTHQTQRHERGTKRRDPRTAAGAGRGGVGRVPLERGERDGGE